MVGAGMADGGVSGEELEGGGGGDEKPKPERARIFHRRCKRCLMQIVCSFFVSP
jgi:hypothetical protein